MPAESVNECDSPVQAEAGELWPPAGGGQKNPPEFRESLRKDLLMCEQTRRLFEAHGWNYFTRVKMTQFTDA